MNDANEANIIGEGAAGRDTGRVLRGPSHPRPWISRVNLWDWIWTYPVNNLDELFCSNIGAICVVYDIVRPDGRYFQRLRSGKQPERTALSDARPCDQPIPLVTFELDFEGTSNTAHYEIPLDMSAELGGPPDDQRPYPRPADAGPIELRLAQSGKRISLRADPYGPPRAMTRRDLRKLAKGLLDDPDKIHFLGLYGLTMETMIKLLERENIAIFGPIWKWDNHLLGNLPSTISRARFNKAVRGEGKTLVELTPAIREELEASWTAEIEIRNQRRAEKAEGARTTRLRDKQRLEEHFEDFLRLIADGLTIEDARIQLKLPSALLAERVRKLFDTRMPYISRPLRHKVARRIHWRDSFSPAEEALIFLVCQTPASRSVNWRGIDSSVYSNRISRDRLISLACRLSSAAEVLAATKGVSDALADLKTAIESSETGGLLRLSTSTTAVLDHER